MPTTEECQTSRHEPLNDLLIVGASARFCVQSAVRAGFHCVAIDQFGDWDLTQIAIHHAWDRLSEKTENTADWLAGLPCQFLICGGMEKRVSLIRRLQSFSQLLGPQPDDIDKTNDPTEIQQFCRLSEINFPETIRCDRFDRAKNQGGDFLIKRLTSSGGLGIRIASTDSKADSTEFYQQHISGGLFSSVYAASPSGTSLLGSTIQLIGKDPVKTAFNRIQAKALSPLKVAASKQQKFEPATAQLPNLDLMNHASRRFDFTYAGSIGPVHFSNAIESELTRIGAVIADRFGMAGVFGLDWVLDADGKVWLIEINPRIPASCEVLELAGQISNAVSIHFDAISAEVSPSQLRCQRNKPTLFVGKQIVYSDCESTIRINDQVFEYFRSLNALDPMTIADIPNLASTIRPGAPVVSIFSYGQDLAEIRSALQKLNAQVRRKIQSLDQVRNGID